MKTLVLAITAGTLALGSVAFAAPRVMSPSAMDNVSAGQSLVSWFLGDDVTVDTPSSTTDTQTSDASGDNAQAASGANAANKAAGALADHGAQAINGDGNTAVEVQATISIPISNSANASDTENTATADENGAIAISGTGNTAVTTFDNSNVSANGTVEDDIAPNQYEENSVTGVVARTADVCDSFNTNAVTIDVEVTIDDSFNNTTTDNALSISGQDHLTAIVNANTLGDQLIGATLNVTNATTAVPATTTVPSMGDNGNATATTTLTQTVVNASLVVVPDVTTVAP